MKKGNPWDREAGGKAGSFMYYKFTWTGKRKEIKPIRYFVLSITDQLSTVTAKRNANLCHFYLLHCHYWCVGKMAGP